MNLYVLIPTYREGELLRSCINSAKTTGGRVIVFEGAVGDAEDSPRDEHKFATGANDYRRGRWVDDADKRSAMLRFVQNETLHRKRADEPLWICWLDSDEILLWGEYLPDLIRRTQGETGAGGCRLRLVEMDGSVVACNGRVIRGDIVSHYVHSIVTVELTNGMIVSLPNEPICHAGGVPIWSDESRKIEVDDLAYRRPPVAGEPHYLHRTSLRDPNRNARRQSDAESDWYRENAPA